MDKLAKIYEDTKLLIQDRNKLNLFMNNSARNLLVDFTKKDKDQVNTLLDSWIDDHQLQTRSPYNGLYEILGIFTQDLVNKGILVTKNKLHLLVKLLLISYINNQTPESAILKNIREASLYQLFLAQTREQAAQQPVTQELSAQELLAQTEREALEQAIQPARELEARELEARKLEARELEARELEARKLEAQELEAREAIQ